MTLAQQLVNRERTKTQLIDDGFNRHAFNVGGDGLPSWFLDDEQRHFRNNIPVTKEAVQALREKMRALNARPIKKIAEAKARKKMRTIRRIEKTRAKAQGINDDEDNGLTEKEKASSIAKVLAKSKSAAAKPVKKEIKLVVARGLNRAQKGRPKGVKGRYKVRLFWTSFFHQLSPKLTPIFLRPATDGRPEDEGRDEVRSPAFAFC